MPDDTSPVRQDVRVLLTVTEFSLRFNWSQGGIRHLIFHARRNGFDRVIRRVGRKILLDQDQFFRWLDQRNKVEGVDAHD